MNKLKIAEEEAIKIYENAGLLLLEKYKGSKYKHLCRDRDGYEYALSLDSVKDKRTKGFQKYSKFNSRTIYNLKLFIKENNLKCILLENDDRIVTEKDKLRFKCWRCGKEYLLCYNHLLSYKKETCNQCSYDMYGETNKYPMEYYEQELDKIGYKMIKDAPQSYRQVHIYDENGYKYRATFPNLKNGSTPIKFHKQNPYTIENMKLYIKDNDIPAILIEDNNMKHFDVRTHYLRFSCVECGKEYKATWEQIIFRHRYRCEYCSKIQSKYEYFVEQYLLEKNVKFIKQKRYSDCKNIRSLPFDFYLQDYNYIIEVQGYQHYYENVVFHETLEHRKAIDKIKEDYCRDNDIEFVAIPFWHIVNNHSVKRYKEIIDNIIGQSSDLT